MIAAEAERAAAGADGDLARAGRLYLARTTAEIRAIGEVPDAATGQLSGQMRAAISDMVQKYVRELDESAKGAIPPYLVAAITEEACAAVG